MFFRKKKNPSRGVNFSCLMYCFRFGALLGIVPFSPRSISRLYALILVILWNIFSYFCIKEKFSFTEDFSLTIKLIVIVLGFVESAFVSFCIVYNIFFLSRKWHSLLEMSEELEVMFEDKRNKERMIWPILKLCLMYFNYFLVFGLQYYYWVDEGFANLLIGYTDTAVCYFYEITYMAFYIFFTHWLKCKYKSMNNHLMSAPRYDVNRIKRVKRFSKCACELIRQYEKVLGDIIFIQISVMILDVLCTMSYALFNNSLLDFYGQILNFLFAIIYPMSLFIMIMCCDSLEACGREMIKTCYTLHAKMENGVTRNEILSLAVSLEQWRPILTAGGIYAMNRKCILKICSSFITYFSVITQFTLAMTVKNKNEP